MKNKNTPTKAVDSARTGDKLSLSMLLPLTLSNAPLYPDKAALKRLLEGIKSVHLDMSGIDSYDSFLVIYINSIKQICADAEIQLEISGMTDDVSRFIAILTPKAEIKAQAPQAGFFYRYMEYIGSAVLVMLQDGFKFVEFTGDMLAKLLKALIKPSTVRWKEFPFHFMRAGVNAVPITLLILFLLGVITGYQGALQLSKFGADKFISALIGISITRELSPLMVAILVAGRSGSAYAAEIGTMKVSEEVDALTSMGFNTMQFLVMPRVLAVVLAMPILTIICDIAGVAGGLLASISTLDVTVSSYISGIQTDVAILDVVTGLFKSMVFGGLIAAVGCFRGLQVSGGAESVGRFTTASVVTGVFLIIFCDSIFTFLFQSLGI